MLKSSSIETHPQKISWTCRPLLCSGAPAHLLCVSQVSLSRPQSVTSTLSLIPPHIFSLSDSLLCCLHKHWPRATRHTVAVLSNSVPSSLSLFTHLCLVWMKSLSFWDSVKPHMENYFILPAGLCHWLTDSSFEEGGIEGREGGGLKEKEEGGRMTASNWHEAERQWKTPMASLPFEFMSVLLPLIGHSSIVLRRLSPSVSPNQRQHRGQGWRWSFMDTIMLSTMCCCSKHLLLCKTVIFLSSIS